MGVQLPLPAPAIFLSEPFSSKDLRAPRLHWREAQVPGFRYKNGYSAQASYFEQVRKKSLFPSTI